MKLYSLLTAGKSLWLAKTGGNGPLIYRFISLQSINGLRARADAEAKCCTGWNCSALPVCTDSCKRGSHGKKWKGKLHFMRQQFNSADALKYQTRGNEKKTRYTQHAYGHRAQADIRSAMSGKQSDWNEIPHKRAATYACGGGNKLVQHGTAFKRFDRVRFEFLYGNREQSICVRVCAREGRRER